MKSQKKRATGRSQNARKNPEFKVAHLPIVRLEAGLHGNENPEDAHAKWLFTNEIVPLASN